MIEILYLIDRECHWQDVGPLVESGISKIGALNHGLVIPKYMPNLMNFDSLRYVSDY